MAATSGNRFWELRSKHGRNTLFETPELMWDAACEYFEWCEENPFIEIQLVSYQGNTTQEELPKMRPFTMQGLCSYLGCNTVYFNQFKATQAGKREDFSKIISSIQETIYNQKFSGAASGFLNANIIARDLGLTEKTHVEQTGVQKVVIERRVVKRSELDLPQKEDGE